MTLCSSIASPWAWQVAVKKDYGAVRQAIADTLEVEDYDDGVPCLQTFV